MEQSELGYLREHFKNNTLVEIIDLAFEIYPDMTITKAEYEELKLLKKTSIEEWDPEP